MTDQATQISIAVNMLKQQLEQFGEERVSLTSSRSHGNELVEEITYNHPNVKVPTRRSSEVTIRKAKIELGLSSSPSNNRKKIPYYK